MAYSFFEIERQKSWIIWGLFISLVLFYLLSSIFIWATLKFSILLYGKMKGVYEGDIFLPLTSLESWIMVVISLIIGIFHFSSSQYRVIDRFLGLLKAEPLKPEDKYHQVLKNTIEEASVACGRVGFEAYTIPTSALNAFSIADFSGRKVIGVTEGLLAKLNRSQLQAVIGHEIAHILSGDCLTSTITASIFEFYSAQLEKVKKEITVYNESAGTINTYPANDRSALLLVPVYLAISIVRSLAYLINIFISREREYRADAIAARLTRDPLSLAQALYIISRGWRGEGMSGSRLSTIFIVNPRYSELDESEGLSADMLSTHPPIKKRIDILLRMSGVDEKTLEQMTTVEKKELKIEPIKIDIEQDKKWFVSDAENKWSGPFDLSQVLNIDWLKPYSWVRLQGDDTARPAYEYADLKPLFQPSVSSFSSEYSCPDCYHGLEKLDYEGRQIWHCPLCKGFLLNRTDLKDILLRSEERFSEDIARKAELIINDSKVWSNKNSIGTQNLLNCPLCQKKMQRLFFAWRDVDMELGDVVHLPIDKCIWCDLFWLDRNKIDILQYIFEKYQNG